jgi:hypothetical protein
MDVDTDKRVTTAIALARIRLKASVDIGLFRRQPPETTLKGWHLIREMQVPQDVWVLSDLPIYDDERGRAVIAKAMDGDADADALLREIACEKLREGLPPNLATYIGGILAGDDSRRRGSPQKYYSRDFMVYLTVYEMVEDGFSATRNSATKDRELRESACSIVSAALAELGVNLSEKSIERIWKETSARFPSSLINRIY